MTRELTCSPSLDQSSALITRCHLMKHSRWGPICANVDGTARRRTRSPGIRCRIENCIQSFTAVFDLARSRDRTFIAMGAAYCGHSLSIRTAEIADYCESDVRRDHRPTVVTLDHYDRRPSLFRQYKHISTQNYRDGRKDNSRCKLRDLFYFWCGLLLAWRRCQRRLLGWLRR